MYNLNFKKKTIKEHGCYDSVIKMAHSNDENTLYFDFFLPKINEGYDLHFFLKIKD